MKLLTPETCSKLNLISSCLWCCSDPQGQERKGWVQDEASADKSDRSFQPVDALSVWTVSASEGLRVAALAHSSAAVLALRHTSAGHTDKGPRPICNIIMHVKRPRTLSLLSTVCHSNWITMNGKTRWRWLPGLQLTTGSTNVHLFYLCLRPKSTISDNLELHIHRHWLSTVEIVPTTQSAVWSTGHFLTPAHRLYSEIHICKYIHVVQLCESQGPGVIRHKKMTRR